MREECEAHFINLASAALGAKSISASDEFFAPRERLLNDESPVFLTGKYDQHGKWMDGWETRRRRGLGHDWCIIRLAVAGELVGVDIDTTHFTGNFPQAAALDVTQWDETPTEEPSWLPILALTELQGNGHNFFQLNSGQAWTHVRLRIFPDGGVARLRVYGIPARRHHRDALNLASALEGARIVACNDAHYGRPQNLLLPGPATSMAQGWETRRRREPGNDWVIIALGCAGHIERVEVDTAYFQGNYPDACSLQAIYMKDTVDSVLISQSLYWPLLLAPNPLHADQLQSFVHEMNDVGVVSHVRFNIFPDGGVARIRLWGQPE